MGAMPGRHQSLDLLFLGSGNAFGAGGKAFSSFLLNGRYLFDCGPTVLQQLRKAGVPPSDIEVVLVSHFHADHFFGLPFLFLDARYKGRTKDICVVGPPGIQERTETLLRIGYPGVLETEPTFKRRYIEVADGFQANVAGLSVLASVVDHVAEMECFAFRAELGDRSLVYSGDTTLCDGLLRLVKDADVIVLECSREDIPVHLGAAGVEEVARRASPGAQLVVTHLDGNEHSHPLILSLSKDAGLHVAEDLARFSF